MAVQRVVHKASAGSLRGCAAGGTGQLRRPCGLGAERRAGRPGPGVQPHGKRGPARLPDAARPAGQRLPRPAHPAHPHQGLCRDGARSDRRRQEAPRRADEHHRGRDRPPDGPCFQRHGAEQGHERRTQVREGPLRHGPALRRGERALRRRLRPERLAAQAGDPRRRASRLCRPRHDAARSA